MIILIIIEEKLINNIKENLKEMKKREMILIIKIAIGYKLSKGHGRKKSHVHNKKKK